MINELRNKFLLLSTEVSIAEAKALKNKEQLSSLEQLIIQLEQIDTQIQQMKKELTVMQKEYTKANKPNKKVNEPIFKIIDNDTSYFSKQITLVNDSLSEMIDKSFISMKENGVLAFYKISNLTDIKNRLSKLVQRIDTSISSIKNKIMKIENISSDFRDTTAQVKNFSLSLVGKAPIVDSKSQGVVASSMINGLKKIVQMQDKIQYAIVYIFNKIDDMDKTAIDIKSNKDNSKESISKALKKYANELKNKHSRSKLIKSEPEKISNLLNRH